MPRISTYRLHQSAWLAALLLAATSLSASAAISTATLPADYRILDHKSIFSRDRMTHSPRAEAQRPRTEEKPTPPRVYIPILAGTIQDEIGNYVAFIADPGSGQMLPVRVGDQLPNNAGTVQNITLNYIETTSSADTKPKRVLIGQNILGGPADYASGSAPASSSASSSPPGSAGPSASPGPSAPAPSGNVNDIIEQMKRRRLQQLGK